MMTLRQLWKLKMGTEELLDQGWASGKLIEKVVGHLTYAALLARELLSCFEAVYVFIKKHYAAKARLWPRVRRELFCAWSSLASEPIWLAGERKGEIEPGNRAGQRAGEKGLGA